MRQLLRASYDNDFSKVALDGDGDLLSLVELPVDVSTEALRAAVDQVAILADNALDLLGPATKGGATEEQFPASSAGQGATMSVLRGAFELSYDPAKWKVGETKAGVTQLNHVSGELWAKIIPERIEIEKSHFTEIVLHNAQEVDPNARVVVDTWRTVNGLQVDVLRYDATSSGMKVTFYNQMYSDSAGTVQIAGWTGTNLFDDYRRDFLELFAGFHKMPGSK
jgi:hypothetical protein